MVSASIQCPFLRPPYSASVGFFQAAGLLVVQEDAVIELAGHAADGRLVADVGGTESAGGQAARCRPGSTSTDGLAHPRHLHRRRHAAGGAAIDDDVVTVGGHRGGNDGKTQEHYGDDTIHAITPLTPRSLPLKPPHYRAASGAVELPETVSGGRLWIWPPVPEAWGGCQQLVHRRVVTFGSSGWIAKRR